MMEGDEKGEKIQTSFMDDPVSSVINNNRGGRAEWWGVKTAGEQSSRRVEQWKCMAETKKIELFEDTQVQM